MFANVNVVALPERRLISGKSREDVTLLTNGITLCDHRMRFGRLNRSAAFRSGLADAVGLGKTIEAGLFLAQQWAERKRRLLVILPANLRNA